MQLKEYMSDEEGVDENINYLNQFSAKPNKRVSIKTSLDISKHDEDYLSSDSQGEYNDHAQPPFAISKPLESPSSQNNALVTRD